MATIHYLHNAAERSDPVDGPEARHREHVSAHARKIRAAAASGVKAGPADIARLATHIHALLDEAHKASGMPKGEIATAVSKKGLNLRDVNGTSKRFDTFTLPPELTGQRRERRLIKLKKKVAAYIDLADRLADIAGVERDANLHRVFEGTDYGAEPAGGADWEAEPWNALERLLRAVSLYVVREAGLDGWWEDVRRLPGSYDVRTGRISAAGGALCLHNVPLDGDSMHFSEAPPIPSIPLCRSLQAPPAPGRLALDGGEWVEARFLLWREVRLAVGPVTVNSRLGPLLEVRTVLEAETKAYPTVTFDSPYTDGTDRIWTANAEGQDVPVRVGAPSFPKPADGRTDHNCFGWTALSPARLRSLLSAGRHDGGRAPCGWVARGPGIPASERPPSWFGPDEPAYWVETDLHLGFLEQDLLAECRRMVELVQAHKANLAARLRDQTEATLARWQQAPGTSGEEGGGQ